jgi:hypothetical protein
MMAIDATGALASAEGRLARVAGIVAILAGGSDREDFTARECRVCSRYADELVALALDLRVVGEYLDKRVAIESQDESGDLSFSARAAG